MKTIAKIFRKGQNFYIVHTPSKGEYDNIGPIEDDEVVIKMQNNKKGYESGYLFITQGSSDEGMRVSDFILQNRLLGFTRTGICNRLKEVKSGCEIYIMYYDAKLYKGRPVKLDLVWASCVIDQDIDNDSRIKLSRDVARLIPKYSEQIIKDRAVF